ncbi:MAG: cupin domain-containing protein [Firmicutes bacterium]|nr:cupin domain-containing protein [Bacillota bacterium]
MSRVIFWEHPGEPVPESGAHIRCDLAWPLFLPDSVPGALPEQQPRALGTLFGRWFWESMGLVAGRLRADAPDTVWLVTPRLTPAAREYLTRLASFWSDEVFYEYPADGADNHWIAPAVDLAALPSGPLWSAMTERLTEGVERHLVPMVGIGRIFAKVQEVAAGYPSARLHSHTAQDEYYLILKGTGTLRMGRHTEPVSPGTFIAKPIGPDLPTHILADRGESVTILDIEVYADPRQAVASYDIMSYRDHGEVVLTGPGWENMVPDAVLDRTEDVFSHYFEGYVRDADGSIQPQEFPGHPPRVER